MRGLQLPWSLRTLSLGAYDPCKACITTSLAEGLAKLRLHNANAAVEGRRYATVRSQGVYKQRSNKTIPKKMGAKRIGDQYVIPGNIIYKQRGTIWHPGENTILGRDHTIHAAVAGFVKYYRDPDLHPSRQYIGVAFERTDTLPYPRNAVRHRKLALMAVTRREHKILPKNSPSNIPNIVSLPADAVKFLSAAEAKTAAKLSPADAAADTGAKKSSAASKKSMRAREYHLRDDYSYSEANWQLGRLVGKPGRQIGSIKGWSRKAVFRSHRRKREAELAAIKSMTAEQAKKRAAARVKEEAQRAKDATRAAEELAKREARFAELEAMESGATEPGAGGPVGP